MEGVEGEGEGGVGGDVGRFVCVGGGDGEALGRGEAETAGGDGGVEAEGFVDAAV